MVVEKVILTPWFMVSLVHAVDHGSWLKWLIWFMLWTMVHGLSGACCGPWFMVEVVNLVHVVDDGSWFKWFIWFMLWTMVHG